MKVFTNAKFISCEDESRTFSVMAVDKGKIAYIGDTLPPLYDNARRVDLGGATVVPIFGDTHLHFQSYSFFLSTVDVRTAGNFDEMGNMLRGYMQNNPKTKLLLAFGCSGHCVEEKRLPVHTDLDKMLDTPLMIVKYDGHAAVANTALISKLPQEIKDDEGFDAETGWLYLNAFYMAVNFITASVSPLKIIAGMEFAAYELAKAGLGYLHTTDGVGYKNDIDIDTLRAISYGLPQCIRLFFQTTDTDKVVRRRLPRIGGCFELAIDGCFGSKDAAISGGYTDEPENEGFLFISQQELNDFCIKANRLNLQISVHAIGDVAVDRALTAFEAALSDYPRKDSRHIIIHADLIPQPMIKRAAALGISIALQPNFLQWKEEPAEYLERILGERIDNLIPLRDLVDAGILIGAGSDAPCTVPNPIESMHNCCNHPNPAQSVTPIEALKMHTLWPAKMCFDENRRGSLSVGKIADFVVLSGNPLEVPIGNLRELRVTDTYFEGKRFDCSRKPSLFKLLARMAVSKFFKTVK